MANAANPLTPGGAQIPTKYTHTGPMYQHYGEQPGFIYDPLIDKYRPDPKARKQWEVDNGFREPDPKPVSAGSALANQAASTGIATLGTVGGLYGAKQIGSLFADKAVEETAKQGVGALANTGAQTASTGLLGGATAGAGAVGSGATAIGSVEVAGQAGTLMSNGAVLGADGAQIGTMAADGSISATTGLLAPALGALGAGLGAYGIYQASKMSDKKMGIGTGLASGAAMGAGIGTMVPIPVIGTVGGALVGAAIGGLLGATAHETTKARTTRRYGKDLMKKSDDPTWQNLVNQGAQESLAGKDTWDIGDDPNSAPIDLMTRSYGVLKTFGTDWLKYTPQQQQEIVRQGVGQNLLNSKQGDYIVDNPSALKAIADKVAPGASSSSGLLGSPFDASGKRTRPWQPGDKVYGK